MNNFDNFKQLFKNASTLNKQGFILGDKVYSYVRTDQQVKRREFDNLTCVSYRNEENHHNINVYYDENEGCVFTEDGYSVS